MLTTPSLVILATLAGCSGGKDDPPPPPPGHSDHGPIAADIMGAMGEPLPSATDEQLATFDRGRAVMLHRFSLEEGVGPSFNVTFCGSCHEKPAFGGSSGLYRNFFLAGEQVENGPFFPTPGLYGGVQHLYHYNGDNIEMVDGVEMQCVTDNHIDDERFDASECGEVCLPTHGARPVTDPKVNVVAQRNAIPFFGVGLLAELPEEVILANQDPDDADGDGISGRPNYDRGFVGRFGRKAQTVSIEGFIRGPLFNHLGITTDPLTDDQRAELPVDSSGDNSPDGSAFLPLRDALSEWAQAAAPDGPTCDQDLAPDPEMPTSDLFDLVSFSMLLAAPEFDELSAAGERGRDHFDAIGCGDCHVPRLEGPRGPIPAYSDLLLHDMGPDMDDGLFQGEATGAEFRTQPLWGLAATAPYLHDGRASTIDEAILWHGGEGTKARNAYSALAPEDQADLIEFLLSLGGRDQYSTGLIPPGTEIDPVGAYGGPYRTLTAEEEQRFLAGRELFDREHGHAEGAGAPRLNGDSCRACHFDLELADGEPFPGGAGPRGVNVTRHGILNDDGEFVPPHVGTILHRTTSLKGSVNRAQPDVNLFEHRQTPHVFGLGVIETIADEDILANADVEDLDGDGISGKPSWVDGGRLGRFGWKGQVPTVDEFVRDAVFAELGMTLPYEDGMTFGRIQDNDEIADPEFPLEDAHTLGFYLKTLAPPPRQPSPDPGQEVLGEQVFSTVGCADCHIPELPGSEGPVPLYSDLLLHEVLPPGAPGTEEASATMQELRTPPLWGVSQTAPYLHSGNADTLDQAIRMHDGEAAGVRDAYLDVLTQEERDALVTFLETL